MAKRVNDDSDDDYEHNFSLSGPLNKLKKFLQTRGIDDDLITYIISEKIDTDSLLNMTESEFSELFPKYGDRIAVQNFCRRQTSEHNITKKEGLLERLRKKMSTYKSKSKQENGNKSSKTIKMTRKVEIGWLHYDDISEKYIQVRTKQGGGTRQLDVPKVVGKIYMIHKAKELFFRNGQSTKGSSSEFQFDIYDFKQSPMENWMTIDNIFEISGLSKVRFYLATKRKSTFVNNKVLDSINDDESASSSMTNIVLNARSNIEINNTYNDIPHSIIQEESRYRSFANIVNTTNQEEININNILNNSFHEESRYSVTNILNTTNDTEINTNDRNEDNNFEESTSSIVTSTVNATYDVQTDTNNETEDLHSIKVQVHRGNVMNDLISFYLENDTKVNNFLIEIILPNGDIEKAVDNGGVLRDCLSEFWSDFYDKCTIGNTFKIPIIRHDFSSDKWKAISKIIKIGWNQEKYFPIKLALPFMEYCILGQHTTDLLTSFMKFVPKNDAQVLDKALNDYSSVDKDELMDLLSELESKNVPSESNLKLLLTEISHRDLVQKPKFIIDSWHSELEGLIGMQELHDIYINCEPTYKNIQKILSFPETLTQDMIKTISFLKKYLKEANENIVSSFLRYCTGSDIITVQKIEINFIKQAEFHRCPIARTCASMLELSYNYDYFPEFRTEFNTLLSSNIWIMDIP